MIDTKSTDLVDFEPRVFLHAAALATLWSMSMDWSNNNMHCQKSPGCPQTIAEVKHAPDHPLGVVFEKWVFLEHTEITSYDYPTSLFLYWRINPFPVMEN